MAPRYMSRPQNFESSSLLSLRCLTYFVSFAGSIGGCFFVRLMAIEPWCAGSIRIRVGTLERLPGAVAHCWPSPRSIGSLTVLPSARWKVW